MKNQKNDYQIISLGKNCFVRVILTEYNLIKTKRQGRKSMPFDLAGHSIDAVINHFNNDFKDYFDGIVINDGRYINKKHNADYPHDKDCLRNFNKFEKRYINRIENFKEAILDNTFTFFVLWGEYKQNELEELYSVLNKIRKGNNFKLIVWNYSNYEINSKNENILVFTKPIPEKNWAWHKDEVKKQKHSIDYKNDLIDFIKNQIVQSGFDVVIYKENFFDIFTKKIQIFIKNIFSVGNDNTNNMKFLMIFGKKIKIKNLK